MVPADCCFVAASTTGVSPTAELVMSAAGAFFGAVFAFGFFLVGNRITWARDRQMRHHSALVKYEFLLNQYLEIIGINRSHIAHFLSAVGRGAIAWNTPREFPTYTDGLPSLMNLPLINELFSLSITIDRLNGDISNLNSAYGEIKRLLMEQRAVAEYAVNAETIGGNYKEIDRHLEKTRERVINVLAMVRVLAKRDNPMRRWLTLRPSSAKVAKKAIDAERLVILDELRTVAARAH